MSMPIRTSDTRPKRPGSFAFPRSRFAPATAAMLLLFLAQASHSLIVHEGKIVPAWPDAALQPAEPGNGSGVPGDALGKSAATAVHHYPHPAGEVWGLTLLVDFSDQAPAFTAPEIDEWLNLKGFSRFNCKGSVRDYFADVSNGKVDFRNEIHGFYRAKNPKAYYEGGEGYARAGELVAELMQHFDGSVDFSKFDNDKDGKVEAVSIVYAGAGVEWGKGLWPHAGGLNQRLDGVQLTRYMMTDLGQSFGLYVFCHEVGHMLFGWPDLYGFGDYCLMGNRPNNVNPVTINDFYRADQGWIDVIDIDKDANAFHKAGANAASGFRYLNPARPQECFFWSNLKNEGRRAALTGRGLLVLHFDKDVGKNDVAAKLLSLAVVQADGKRQLDTATWPNPGSDPKDYFSQANGARFGESTLPASKWNNGTASGLTLYDIGPAADTMTFYVGNGVLSVRPVRGTDASDRSGDPAHGRFDRNGRPADGRPAHGIAYDAKGARLPPTRPSGAAAWPQGGFRLLASE